MTDPATLRDLLARVKAATGADREIDYLIHGTVKGWRLPTDDHPFSWATVSGYYQYGDPDDLRRAIYIGEDRLPLLSASIDAALALAERVLPERAWRLWKVRGYGGAWMHDAEVSEPKPSGAEITLGGGQAASLPLAILAATLAALIEQEAS